jgi:TetR/AcrR family transcriptional regulator, ethionamide resistance regulator
MTSASQQTTTRQTRERSRQRIIDAATELVRERSYAQLSVGEIMERAGIGRTIFYRHFDDLGDLLVKAAREAIDELYRAQQALAATRVEHGPEAVRVAIELAVDVYGCHGPLLRAVSEAAAGDELVAAGRAPILARFDELVVTALRQVEDETGQAFADPGETARALNLLAESYLLDAFGREPRVSVETAVETLTEIWVGLVSR